MRRRKKIQILSLKIMIWKNDNIVIEWSKLFEYVFEQSLTSIELILWNTQ